MSEQNRTTQPEPSLPLRSDYPYPKDAYLAQVWHATGRADMDQVKLLITSDHIRDAIPAANNVPELVQQAKKHAVSAAVKYNQYDLLASLREEGYKASSIDILLAVAAKQTEVVKVLLEHGADVNDPKILCAAIADKSMLDLFLAHGVNWNAGVQDRRDRSKGPRDGNGYFLGRGPTSPLDQAALTSAFSVIKRLIDHGANPALGNPLHAAVSVSVDTRELAETKRILEYLISLGCDVNRHDDEMWKKSIGRPLHWAAEHAAPPESIKVLLDHGADIAGRNHRGETPLDWGLGAPYQTPGLEGLLKNTHGDALDAQQREKYAENWFEPVSWPQGQVSEVAKLWK